MLGSCSAVNENQGFSTLQVNTESKSILRAESEGQFVDLFVFDEDGTLAAYSQMPGSDNIILRNGHSYSIWALADISELELAKTAHLSYLDTLSFSLSSRSQLRSSLVQRVIPAGILVMLPFLTPTTVWMFFSDATSTIL